MDFSGWLLLQPSEIDKQSQRRRLGIECTSTQRRATAERWKHLAWGERTELLASVGVTPGTRSQKKLPPPQFGGGAAELRRGKICRGCSNLGLRQLARSSLPCPRLCAAATSWLVEGCDSISLPYIPPTWALSWMHELATEIREGPPRRVKRR